MLFFFFKLFIFRNFIFLNQGKHPTLTPSFYPPGTPLVPSPSFLPSVLGKVLGGSHWARRASPHDTHSLEWELSPSLPQGTVGGAFELREVTFSSLSFGDFFFYVNKCGFQGPCVQCGLGQC